MLRVWKAITCLASTALAATRGIEGTWSSKSMAVMTGPGFFNPLTDSLLEPTHPGISYSFTSDGYYESAIYQITANPVSPKCPTGMLLWSHGSYVLPADGSIEMTPIAVDGRQLISAPCTATLSEYIRFSVNETMQSYTIELDGYRAQWKLTLNKLYGDPVQPLYLVYDPPQMLPTTTLLPTSSAKAKSKRKRELSEGGNGNGHLDLIWYSAMALLFVGGAAFLGT